jgi:hypothetical protein
MNLQKVKVWLLKISISSVPLPCIVGPWTTWSAPDASGSRFRYRVMLRPALNGGKTCPELINVGKGTFKA